MQDSSGHTLPSFTSYLNKVFAFRQAVSLLSDARRDPDISPQTVFLALFHGFVFRLGSFKELEADLAKPQLRRLDRSRAGLRRRHAPL